MYTKSRNIEIIEGDETDETIEKFFELLLQNYQKKNRRTNERKRVCS